MRRRLGAGLASMVLLGGALIGGGTPSGAAPLLTENFTGSSLSDPTNWLLASGDSSAPPCLTAATTSDVQLLGGGTSIAGCAASAIDSAGSGALRLTQASTSQSGTMQYVNAISTADGLDIDFFLAQYGGNGADGLSFFLKNGANTNNAGGRSGGALGYSGCLGQICGEFSGPGIPGALLGVGFDLFGNFSLAGLAGPAGTTCSVSEPGARSSSIAVRGGDLSTAQDGGAGYCYLGGTGVGGVNYSGASRSAAARKVRIVIDPATATNPQARIYMSGSDLSLPTTPAVEVPLPAEYLAASTFKFGFSGSTGGQTNNHEVWGLQINPATPPASYSRCKGTGSYDTSAGTESFNFVAAVKKTVFDGTLAWKQGSTTKFDGVLTSCVDTADGVVMQGSGVLQVKVGKTWTSRSVPVRVTVSATSKTAPGAFAATFDPDGTPLITSGTLRSGAIQIG
jgi:hypothetical protein